MNDNFLTWEKYNGDKDNPTVLAKVRWLPPDLKNKAQWPRGTEFSLPVNFDMLGQDESWSLVLKVLEPANRTSREVVTQIKFLFEHAPHRVLVPGNPFVFFDKAAKGIVIDADELRMR
ncbi:hypothetical protein SAMN04487970_100255 [Paenibacillus tianmuensis]|uniref:Uncharacterized protein n=1 Tax=Paenibacillus tianmuensis TaxID=624147 RepID=A0A1G4PDN0_9BACL|nr:hypothetical protein [Paenibacillus tianmuensis]SCW30340.1 hypothetical protein SAMN04487970_100255 [Paenibacillus tianmuensis]